MISALKGLYMEPFQAAVIFIPVGRLSDSCDTEGIFLRRKRDFLASAPRDHYAFSMMKTFRLAAVALGLFASGFGNLGAQTLNLTFDYSQLANPAYSGSNLYVTFQGHSGTLTVNGDLYTFVNGTANSSTLLTQSYALDSLSSSSISIANVTSLVGYISYGSSVGFASATAAPSPFTTPTRYANFELTYNNGVGQTDITQIAQFGGGLNQKLFTNISGTTPIAFTGNNLGTVHTTSGAIMSALAGVTSATSNAVITTGPGGTGEYVRVIGPSKFGNSGAPNPYPSFNPYLEHLSDISSGGTLSVARLENLKPGALPGGAGSNGLVYSGTPGGVFTSGSTYLANYYFDTHVTPVISGTTTTYQVVLSGSITLADSANSVLKTYTDLTATLIADSGTNPSMLNNIYSQVLTGQGTDIVFSGTGWGALNADFTAGNATLQPEIVGDFTQGMLAGLVGNTMILSGTVPIGEMTSAAWWDNALFSYTGTNPDFANEYGAIIFENSGGFNSAAISGTFNSAAVYGNPYDDRWGSPVINFTTDTTNTLLISLIPDGNMSVPEPATAGLVVLALTSIFLARRSQSGTPPRGTDNA